MDELDRDLIGRFSRERLTPPKPNFLQQDLSSHLLPGPHLADAAPELESLAAYENLRPLVKLLTELP